jgi:hypothetical protein
VCWENAELAKNFISWSKVHHQMEKKLKVLELQEAMILGFWKLAVMKKQNKTA